MITPVWVLGGVLNHPRGSGLRRLLKKACFLSFRACLRQTGEARNPLFKKSPEKCRFLGQAEWDALKPAPTTACWHRMIEPILRDSILYG